jgi:xanthosine utilization system XapX-like protein
MIKEKVMRAIRFKAFGDPSVLELADAPIHSIAEKLILGLFGMLLGQQAVDMAKRHFVPPAQTSIRARCERRPGPS